MCLFTRGGRSDGNLNNTYLRVIKAGDTKYKGVAQEDRNEANKRL